jgi:cyclic pyranopterin phosphate synthase
VLAPTAAGQRFGGGVVFQDRYERVHDDLRVSVTDRCNLRCSYCMPSEPVWFPRDKILTYEEIHRLVRITTEHGVRKIRLTGGEPLVRRDLADLVGMLAGLAGIEDLSLTTNGLLLRSMAGELKSAGLQRVNVSLDTLQAERFAAMTRRDALAKALDGIAAAIEAGLSPLKVNSVVLRGENDDEIEDLVGHARNHGWELRFIEFMPLENGRTWDLSRVISGAEVRRRIERHWPLESRPQEDPHAPATRFRFRDGRGSVGFVNSVTEPFCASCSRLRLTADGHFRVCLYDLDEVDLKTPLRAGASDEDLAQLMRRAVDAKGRGGALEILEHKSVLPLVRTMHQIGG